MDAAEIAIYRHHTCHTAPPTKPARYAELVVGRRGGKSRILAMIATYLGCVLDHSDYIVPGETPVIAIIAKDRDQAKVIKNYIVGFMREIPAFADMIEDELAETRILATIATYLGCVLDHSDYIVPGETPVIAIIAKDRDQAKVIKNYIVGFMREIPAFADMIEDELAETVRLSNGVVVEVHTASIGAPRGRTFLAVLCDEASGRNCSAGSREKRPTTSRSMTAVVSFLAQIHPQRPRVAREISGRPFTHHFAHLENIAVI